MKKLFSFIVALSLLLMGCEGFNLDQNGNANGDGGASTIFSPADLAKLDGVSAEGATVSLPFTPAYDWMANSQSDWIEVSPKSGVANQQVSLKVEIKKNETTEVRNGVVNVLLNDGANNTIKITVKQNAASSGDDDDEIVLELVDGTEYPLSGIEQELYIKVSTNTTYDIEMPSGATWLSKAEDSRAIRVDVLKFLVSKNDSGSERSAKVRLVDEANGKLVSFTVTQAKYESGEEEKEDPKISAICDVTEVASSGGSVEVDVYSNAAWSASCAAQGVTLSPNSGEGDGVVRVSIPSTTAARDIVIEFTATLNGKSATDVVTIKQQAPNPGGDDDEIVLELVDGTEYALSGIEQELYIKVSTNTTYDIEMPSGATWLSKAEDSRAIRVDVLKFLVSKNDSGSERSAKVRLVDEANGKLVSFTVTQAKYESGEEEKEDPKISAICDVTEVASSGGSVEVDVYSNAAWSASCAAQGVTLSPNSGEGDGVVRVSIPSTTAARDIVIEFTANLNGKSATNVVTIKQKAPETPTPDPNDPTPGEHQEYLMQTGKRFLSYFNPEDTRALATTITDLANNGGFDFRLAGDTRAASTKSGKNLLAEVLKSVSGVANFSPESAALLSTELIFPEDGESYNLDDYKGKQYRFNYRYGYWEESSLGDENKMVAKWDNTIVTLTWIEGTASWEGYISVDYMAKVKNIPSKLDLEITVDGVKELTTSVEVKIPTNYEIETKTAIWLKGGYTFSVVADADRRSVNASVVVAKGDEKLASGGGEVAINDMTDSKNWWTEYTEEWYDGYKWCTATYVDFNFDYPYEQVKTGQGYATILDVSLEAAGNFRTIIDDSENIESTYTLEGSKQLCNLINNNASAVLYYSNDKKKMADVKAEPMPYEYWRWENGSQQLVTEYEAMPVLIFTDGTKFAVDNYFTETAFGSLIESAESLWDRYYELVE